MGAVISNRVFLCLGLGLLAAACSHKPRIVRESAPLSDDGSAVQQPVVEVVTAKQPQRNVFPIQHNPKVQNWIEFFTQKDRARFQRFLSRGAKYKSYIQSVLEENDLPPELYYLAMIESGFQNHARSHASAVGPWQFMSGTGRDYGLLVNSYVDERRDPIHSTEAAASYLRDLYMTLGSWPLAISAYNCGEGCVRRAIRKGYSRNFWKLSKKRLLPKETRNYVPKFMAAVIIGENLEKFGFDEVEPEEMGDVAESKVPGSVRLSTISHHTGVPLKTLRQLNPHLVRGATPPQKQNYNIWVPSDFSSRVADQYAVLAQNKTSLKRDIAGDGPVAYHRVSRGQTLSGIAREHHVSIAYLKRVNGLSSSRIYVNQKIKVSAPVLARTQTHIVRRGETLSGIALKYGRSIASLKRLNGLGSNVIRVGQRIQVKATQYHARHVASKSKTRYRVRRGDNLWTIARRFGVTAPSIKRVNNLSSSKIFVGQLLHIVQ